MMRATLPRAGFYAGSQDLHNADDALPITSGPNSMAQTGMMPKEKARAFTGRASNSEQR
jgi:hypothetical protein